MSLFKDLMVEYDTVEARVARLKAEDEAAKAEREHLRGLLSQEVQNLGLTQGAVLPVEGVGKFNFTTKVSYGLPAEYRPEFVRMLIENGEEALLNIGKADLKSWCEDQKAQGKELPSYITFFEDKFVPNVTLEAAKVRRRSKMSADENS